MLSLFFILISSTFASTAKIDFVAHTNVPGVSVEGKTPGIDVNYNKQKPEGTILEFDVFQLETGMEKRDQHLREKVFSAKNPGDAKIRFEVAQIDKETGVVKGKLSIKGVSNDVTLPVKVSGNEISGNASIKLSDYSLPRPSFMGVKVEESVDINFSFKE